MKRLLKLKVTITFDNGKVISNQGLWAEGAPEEWVKLWVADFPNVPYTVSYEEVA